MRADPPGSFQAQAPRFAAHDLHRLDRPKVLHCSRGLTFIRPIAVPEGLLVRWRMLAHSAAHRASVPIVLDFLAPCVFARGKTTHVTRRPPKLEHISGSSKEPVVPAVPSASSNSDTVTPMQLLNRLDGQLRRFHDHFRLDLPDHTVNIFNRAISDIRNAAEVADIATAQATWQDLKKHEVLRYLGPPQLNMFSRFVAAFCQAKSVESPFTESEVELLQEVATVTAAGGAVDGLREYMLSNYWERRLRGERRKKRRKRLKTARTALK
ncbi:hypothetical protein WOLCODRAFT_160406 [Wolfiporia cocos MD-104 SS10]|uniref:Uncharacterized protein n=1 Tax=Wolfiporia cocos (strain MD-104) TaxID=742152 RepID=A0A2H3IVU6_WOLCO|nr:hypothetical protein WOLCODRAFT_160406 [Wolfiporia cocos MD-104 SS10]